jgi:hypothetical protein
VGRELAKRKRCGGRRVKARGLRLKWIVMANAALTDVVKDN